MLVKKTTHADEMLQNLLYQYRGQTNMEYFISSVLGKQVQDLETAFFQILDDLNPDLCSGIQLDGLGKLVGQDRNNQSDATYRTFIKARMAVNRSTGTLSDIITVLTLLIGGSPTITILEPPNTDPATIDMVITSNLDPSVDGFVCGSFTLKGKDAGVRLLITFQYATAFQFDIALKGFDLGNKFAATTGD